ncbi:MAG: signal peptidase I [Oscillospiraceae bacterium]|nr:signal peptidase I [Oscillospiraceae bacterium]
METQTQQNNTRRVLHIIGNCVGIALIAVLLPIMIANLIIIVRGATNPDEVPTLFGVAPLIVDSGSMYPEIHVNDLIFVRTTDPGTLQRDNIIAFLNDENLLITHRIVGIINDEEGLRFITQGDYTGTPDRHPVTADQVVGVYNGTRLAGVGALAAFLSRPIGMLIFVAVPIALFVLYDLLRRYLHKKKMAPEIEAEKEELERLRALVAQQEQSPAPEIAAETETEPQQQQSQD